MLPYQPKPSNDLDIRVAELKIIRFLGLPNYTLRVSI